MALLDYKIVGFSHKGRHVKVSIRVYRGAVTSEQEGAENVTRYRRIEKVRERTFEYDVPRDMTRDEFVRKVRAHLNQRIVTWAGANGHTVITEERDTSEYEPVDNETEV